ncbi:MAG TPA: glycogen/starch synthase [Dinghuibacter sp.]|uniref:glycogen synthase n=1 Tax=Dinghuibacter sp. TaxID=2024697 RepID=UPI002D17E12F|nr:glycogen/starch synthase [Dinghuibacter sp.]HTJ13790.1 glycogen/starch synthase [Dinghuibacter sp.]
MEIVHVSAECYPVAKVGGLGDVVGALPKYQQLLGHTAKVVLPMYRTAYLYKHDWDVVHKGRTHLGNWWFDYTVIKEHTSELGFDLYLIDIYGLLDREGVYGYGDDAERFTAFQVSFVDWLSRWSHQPDVVHVHDHQAGLIPFIMQYSYDYGHLKRVPTILTIHNAQYQGWMPWEKATYLPRYDTWKAGLLDWKGMINPLACAVRCAWKVTTVSPSYMTELMYNANGLEALFEYEKGKCSGILNGIDSQVWDPATDAYLTTHFDASSVHEGKAAHKRALCKRFHLDPSKPLFIFIGRFVGEKAADLLPAVIGDCFHYIGRTMNFLILGSGDPNVERNLAHVQEMVGKDFKLYRGYNEQLSHEMYAGADFLLMPSRVEPCGLNQMYALRYGTIPIVRSTGGLRDTVVDFEDWQGFGVRFNDASVGDITQAIYRALGLYQDQERFGAIQERIMHIDHSWESSAQQYLSTYPVP